MAIISLKVCTTPRRVHPGRQVTSHKTTSGLVVYYVTSCIYRQLSDFTAHQFTVAPPASLNSSTIFISCFALLPSSSESVRRRTDLFYLEPDRCCVPNSPLWFSSTPLDDSTMEAMLVRTLAVRELQGEDGRAVDQRRSDDTLFTPDEEDSQ